MPIGDGWDLPPGSEPWSDFHWFQASPRCELHVCILSENPVWYTGHYIGGRMVPCPGSLCEACAAAIGAQVRYCFAVAECVGRRAGLLELGRSNGLLVQDWSNRNGGLRGMVIHVSKHSKHPQSRTEIEYCEEVMPMWVERMEVPDPALALYLTWHKAGFPMPAQFAERMGFALRSRAAAAGAR